MNVSTYLLITIIIISSTKQISYWKCAFFYFLHGPDIQWGDNALYLLLNNQIEYLNLGLDGVWT